MAQSYVYELFNGKTAIGTITLMAPVIGKGINIPTVTPFGTKWETVFLKIGYRQISDNGVDYTIRRYLDVRKKSKRQIDLIKDK